MWKATILLALTFAIIVASPVLDCPDISTNPSAYAEWKTEYARSLRPERISMTTSPMEIRTNNGYVEAVVDNTTGEFDEGGDPLGGGGYVKLTYSYNTSFYSSGTEWVMYYVDGTTAKTAGGLSGLPAPDACYSSGDTIFSIWNNWNGVYIRQEIRPVSLSSTPGASEQILFRAVMKSADGASHDCGCIVYYDTMLRDHDDARIATAFGYTGISQIFFATDPAGIPPIWHAYEISFPPAPADLVATGILRGWESAQPDVFWYGSWPSSYGNGWADSEWISDAGGTFGDSATMVKWYPVNVTSASTDSTVFATYYGIGVVEGDFVFDHTPPELIATCSDVHPNPMPLTVQISNGLLETVDNVYVFLDLTGTDLTIISGDNPASFDSIAGFGGSQIVEWDVQVEPDAFGTTQCYTITAVSTEDSIYLADTFCIDIPELISISTSTWADSMVVSPGSDVQLHSSVDWSGGTDILTYSWEPTAGLSDPSLPNPVATVETTTTYILTVGDTTDCVGIDSVIVHMQRLDTIWFSEETDCDGQNVVEICYILRGDPGDISVIASTDGGIEWDAPMVTLENTTNNLGEAISAGQHCFDWVISDDIPDYESDSAQVSIQLGGGDSLRLTTAADFSDGEFAHINIITPDPDGEDDGALGIQAGSDTIMVLQVYPDGHCTDCVSDAIYTYMRDGDPPLNLKIYLMPISTFNTMATSPASNLSVQYIDESGTIHSAEDMVFSDFDVVMFGVADSYGGNDLTTASVDAVRTFCQLGKGLVLMHDTAGCSPGVCMPNFCSLTDISGISCITASSWTLFTNVYRVADDTLPILNAPFEIPDTFSVLNCHWKGQVVEDGWTLYRGIGSGSITEDNLLYWQAYHNSEYNSFSSFYSYGHTEASPMEWEAKAMLNSIYYSYHGGIGAGVYTSSAIDFSSSNDVMVNWSADVPTGASIHIDVAIDTCIGLDECWTEWFVPSAIPDVAFDQIKYRVGMSPNSDDESPILHWIKFSTGGTATDIVEIGPMDSQPPIVNNICPPDTVQYGDTISLGWDIDDLHITSDEPCSIFVYYCDGIDTFLSTDSIVWSPLPVVCESAYFAVSAADSFCNWGYDTCAFVILAAGSIRVAFPETSALACDTIDIPIAITDMYLPLAREFSIYFSVNSAIVTPLSFTPAISPAADSTDFGGSGDNWYVKFFWTDRIYIGNDIFGTVKIAVNCNANGGDFTPLHFDSLKTDLMETHWDNGIIAIEYSPNQWLQVLRFDDIAGIKPRATLAFGNAMEATDDYDAAYDVLQTPAPPTDIQVWFALNDPIHPAFNMLARDIRDMNPVNVWTVIINEDSETYVHWDPRTFDEGLYILNDYQDMRADTDYIAEPYETLIITWSLPEFETQTIHLYPGWNLVSIPVQNPSGSPASIFPGILFGPLGYDAFVRNYYLADHIESGAGYWVFNLIECDIPIIGVPVEQYGRTVSRGWNLLGATIDTLPSDAISISPYGSVMSVFRFDAPTQTYLPSSTLDPGNGYWIFITNGGTIWVPGE